ncbi:MAG: nucleotidyltransferase domain-containing protein [Candidatus Altiarchaeota archaeon]|nr:nucleotidyltransferase domain-containing protein [Candidatus Altiarchaeota archaeon]
MEIRKKQDVVSEAEKKQLRSEDVSKVYDFTAEVSKKFGSFIKAIVVFGSFARNKSEAKGNDIDVMVLVDDSFAPLDQALLIAFQNEMGQLITKYPQIHINTVTISQFWDSVRRGDALAISVLRDAVPLADLGFFAPLQRLLMQGKIRPTQESVNASVSRAFFSLNSYAHTVNSALFTLYNAAVEASHAVVMSYGKIPGAHSEVAGLLRETAVKDGKLTEEDVKVYEVLFDMMKKIERNELDYVKPNELEELHKKTVEFVGKIESSINLEALKQAADTPK